jgi:protein SCO1
MKRQLCPFLLAFALVLTCAAQDAPSSALPSCCQKALEESPTLSDQSIYQVDSTWTNDTGRAVRLADLRGKPQILTLFFTHCQSACPILVHDMKQIESELPANVRSNVGFTLISFDTERDTPGVLAEYRKRHSLDPDRWTLLSGKADDVLELAALLAVKFKEDAHGQFAHSNIITLVNAEGEIVKQQIGLGQSGKELVRAIEQIAASPANVAGRRKVSINGRTVFNEPSSTSIFR